MSSTIANYYAQLYSVSESVSIPKPERTIKLPGSKWLSTTYDAKDASTVTGSLMALKSPRKFLNFDVYLVRLYTTHDMSYYGSVSV